MRFRKASPPTAAVAHHDAWAVLIGCTADLGSGSRRKRLVWASFDIGDEEIKHRGNAGPRNNSFHLLNGLAAARGAQELEQSPLPLRKNRLDTYCVSPPPTTHAHAHTHIHPRTKRTSSRGEMISAMPSSLGRAVKPPEADGVTITAPRPVPAPCVHHNTH